jgi:hypothetical protein
MTIQKYRIIVVSCFVLVGVIFVFLKFGRYKPPAYSDIQGIIQSNSYVNLDDSRTPNEDRLKFYRAHKSRNGTYGLTYRLTDVYILTCDGQLTCVYDSSTDPKSIRKYGQYQVDNVEIGFFEGDNFVEAKETGQYPDLQLRFKKGDKWTAR